MGCFVDEKVLAIKRKILFGENDENAFIGFKNKKEFKFTKNMLKQTEFLLRKTTSKSQKIPAEEDTNYKQIIPYTILSHKNKIFCYQRTPKGTENRLHNKYSLGIGGHINKADEKDKTKIIETAMKRELNEEIQLEGNFDSKIIIGYINKETGIVEKVHFAIVYLIKLENEKIKIKEQKLANGKFMNIKEIEKKKNLLEDWSQTILPHLKKIMKKKS